MTRSKERESKRLRSSSSSSDSLSSLKENMDAKIQAGETVGLKDAVAMVAKLGDTMMDILKKNDELAEGMRNLEGVTKEGNKSLHEKVTDMIMVVDNMTAEIKGLHTKVAKMETQIIDVTRVNQKLSDRILDLELQQIRGNLIIKNVPLLEKARQENRMETGFEAADSFFYHVIEPLGLKDDITQFEAHRYPMKIGPPLLKVMLRFPQQKGLLFRAVSSRNSKMDNSITIKNEYPMSLKDKYKNAEKKAHEIRKDSEGKIRTKITIRDRTVKLLVKERGESTYKEMKIDVN